MSLHERAGHAARWTVRPVIAAGITWLVVESVQVPMLFSSFVRAVGGDRPNWVLTSVDVFAVAAAGAVAAAASTPRSGRIHVVDVLASSVLGAGVVLAWTRYYDGYVDWIATAVAVGAVVVVLSVGTSLLGRMTYRREAIGAVGVLAALLATIVMADHIESRFNRYVDELPLIVPDSD